MREMFHRVSMPAYACSSSVGDMSTGFSGNLGFKIPDNWAFSQFANLGRQQRFGERRRKNRNERNAFSAEIKVCRIS